MTPFWFRAISIVDPAMSISRRLPVILIFSPRGCYLIAMLARTERAKAFRRWILDVLDHLAEPKTPLCVNLSPDTGCVG